MRTIGPCTPLTGSAVLTEAERRVNVALSISTLLRCNSCGLGFRHPAMTEGEIHELYEELPAARWSHDVVSTTSWRLALRWLRRRYPADGPLRILDIGAFDGAFLGELPVGWRRYAIEPSEEAAKRLPTDVQRIARFVDEPEGEYGGSMNVITLLDVVEHFAHPALGLAASVRRLRPGGHLLISTGNMDHWSWDVLRGAHWYVQPQHVAVASAGYFRRLAPSLGLEIEQLQFHAHQRVTFRERYRQVAATVHHGCRLRGGWGRRMAGLIQRAPGLRYLTHTTGAPYGAMLRDHVFVVMRRIS